MLTTDYSTGSTGVLIRRLINTTTGEKYTVFCSEHCVDFRTGTSYNGTYYTPTDATIKRACKIAYFGWYKDNGNYVVDGGILASDMKWVKQAYVFTQQYIWETLGQSSATFRDATVQANYVAFKNDINNKINNMQKRPSFDATTIEINAGETKVLNDTNGVLADYSSIDNTKYNFDLTYENKNVKVVTKHVTVKERVISQAFQIIKISSDEVGEAELLPSAEFTIKAQKDIEKYGSWDAAPITSMVITTESLVADIPEKDCHCGHDNGMGAAGMDGMY